MFAIKINSENRAVSATWPEFAAADDVLVETLPEGDLTNYIYDGNGLVYDPLPVAPEPREVASQLDKLEAQVMLTALMTDTLIK